MNLVLNNSQMMTSKAAILAQVAYKISEFNLGKIAQTHWILNMNQPINTSRKVHFQRKLNQH
ncbi:uncharacterized protein METZ01_LOCUS82497 [marine metagenome]|uniref:Uncharacterized protein n=1 Tax=marine metagenome TaxID=408172 RepID=A0A381US23_9ZZZZ